MKRLIFLLPLFLSCCHVLPSFAIDVHCVAKAVYFEARGESYAGQAAVVQVVMNRAAHRAYPDKPCDVVKYRRNGVWHFSFWNKRDLTIRKEDRYNLALSITKCVIDRECSVPAIGDSTVYYACSGPNGIAFPRKWDKRKLKFQAKIGNHCYYREV